ncbi:hypothetical protein V1509DRAFT_656156 [Lipomyces kononenkoae]
MIVTSGCGQIGIAIVKDLRELLCRPYQHEAIVKEVFEAVMPVVVFNTAGLIPQIAKRLNIQNEKEYVAVNLRGTRNVLDVATAVGSVKAFIFTSSTDVVEGDSWQKLIGVLDNPYAKSKVHVIFLLFLLVNRFEKVFLVVVYTI